MTKEKEEKMRLAERAILEINRLKLVLEEKQYKYERLKKEIAEM